MEVFTEHFIPMLMNETLKQLRKAAISTQDKDKDEVKTLISRFTPAKLSPKKGKGGKKGKDEDMDFLRAEDEIYKTVPSQKQEDDEDEEEEEEKEYNVEIDGAAMKTKNYEQEENEEDRDIK